MRHHGTNDKNDWKMEGIPVDLDERTVNTVAKMGDYVSMGERLVLRVSMIHHYELWFHGEIPLTITIETLEWLPPQLPVLGTLAAAGAPATSIATSSSFSPPATRGGQARCWWRVPKCLRLRRGRSDVEQWNSLEQTLPILDTLQKNKFFAG